MRFYFRYFSSVRLLYGVENFIFQHYIRTGHLLLRIKSPVKKNILIQQKNVGFSKPFLLSKRDSKRSLEVQYKYKTFDKKNLSTAQQALKSIYAVK